MDLAYKIIKHIENKRSIAIGKRLERVMFLNRKGTFKPDKNCKRLSKEVSKYTLLLKEIDELIEIETLKDKHN